MMISVHVGLISRTAFSVEQDENSVVSRAWFALCPHDENAEIAEHWGDWWALLPDPAMTPVLAASDIMRAGEAEGHSDWAARMRDRYVLGH